MTSCCQNNAVPQVASGRAASGQQFQVFGFGANDDDDSSSSAGGNGTMIRGSNVNVNISPDMPVVCDTPEIRKYKKRFSSDILCAALWGNSIVWYQICNTIQSNHVLGIISIVLLEHRVKLTLIYKFGMHFWISACQDWLAHIVDWWVWKVPSLYVLTAPPTSLVPFRNVEEMDSLAG